MVGGQSSNARPVLRRNMRRWGGLRLVLALHRCGPVAHLALCGAGARLLFTKSGSPLTQDNGGTVESRDGADNPRWLGVRLSVSPPLPEGSSRPGSPDAAGPRVLDFDDNSLVPHLVGEHDRHLALIEDRLGSRIVPRGNRLAISGAPPAITQTEAVLTALWGRLERGLPLDVADVEGAIRTVTSALDDQARAAAVAAISGQTETVVSTKLKITARSQTQATYLEALGRDDLVFGIGPAGTGKTYLAVAQAVALLRTEQVKRLIITRPAVEAGERLGFLPGDLKEKVDPYLRPIYDALYTMMPRDRVQKLIEQGTIEIAPLAYMRGRTLSQSFVLLDEAQNTTSMQMKMVLTRLGRDSRMVITGDTSQIDLPRGVPSGLVEALRILDGVPGISFVQFSSEDVVRHRLVGRIIQAYDREAARDRPLRDLPRPVEARGGPSGEQTGSNLASPLGPEPTGPSPEKASGPTPSTGLP